mgnify:FL=1
MHVPVARRLHEIEIMAFESVLFWWKNCEDKLLKNVIGVHTPIKLPIFHRAGNKLTNNRSAWNTVIKLQRRKDNHCGLEVLGD